MERRCGICGGYKVTVADNGAFICETCGAVFSNEKEYQKALQKIIDAEAKEAEKKAADAKARQLKKEKQDRINAAVPYVTFKVSKESIEKDVVLCRLESGGAVVEIDGKRKMASSVTIKPVKFIHSTYEYKPSKTIYTGASSGGIAMGGFHETQAGYVEHYKDTGHYFITLNINGDESYSVDSIRFCDEIASIIKNQTGLPKEVSIISNKSKLANEVGEAYKLAYDLKWDYYKTKSYVDGIMAPYYPTKERADVMQDAVDIALTTKPASCIYEEAMTLFNEGSEYKKKEAIAKLKTITPYKDSSDIISEYEKEQQALKYERACKYSNSKNVGEIKEAVELFKALGKYRDSETRLKGAENNLKNVASKKTKKLILIVAPVICLVVGFMTVMNTIIIPNKEYDAALAMMNSGNYEDAITAFNSIDGYKDSLAKIEECNTAILDGKYDAALAMMNSGNYEDAIIAFNSMDGYKDSLAKIEECNTAILDGKYDAAVAILEDKDYINAYDALIKLEGYKDSAELADSIYEKRKEQLLKEAEVGDTVVFGMYEQDNDKGNGKEEIEWQVLEKKGGRLLVISKYGLDTRPYHSEYTNVTWATSTLRDWLNEDFVKDAFSKQELAKIPTVTVSADKNPEYNTNQGKTTHDKIFLLSVQEAYEYFVNNSDFWIDHQHRTSITIYAASKRTASGRDCTWWLRTSGETQKRAAVAHDVIVEDGHNVDGDDYEAVRPAMWIEID